MKQLDMSAFSEADILSVYLAARRELRRLGYTANVVGERAERLVATALGGQLAANSQKSWDVLVGGERVQVKSRVVSDPIKPGQQEIGAFSSFDFDYAVIVLLSDVDLSVLRAVMFPRHLAESLAVYRKGSVLYARPAVMDHPGAQDLTALLRAAETPAQAP
jgi:hypothetical protein